MTTVRPASTTAFGTSISLVLLWGGAAIFTHWALDHGSVFAVLVLRFILALPALAAIGIPNQTWWPKPGTAWQVAGSGLLLIGAYSVYYVQAIATVSRRGYWPP